MNTADDCAGPDGINGNADDGLAGAVHHNNGGGTGDYVYCSTAIADVEAQFPFDIVSFRQR